MKNTREFRRRWASHHKVQLRAASEPHPFRLIIHQIWLTWGVIHARMSLISTLSTLQFLFFSRQISSRECTTHMKCIIWDMKFSLRQLVCSIASASLTSHSYVAITSNSGAPTTYVLFQLAKLSSQREEIQWESEAAAAAAESDKID